MSGSSSTSTSLETMEPQAVVGILLGRIAELEKKIVEVSQVKKERSYPPDASASGHRFFTIPKSLTKGSADEVICCGEEAAKVDGAVEVGERLVGEVAQLAVRGLA